MRVEDTTRGIGGGEAEESLDPGTLAKRKRRRVYRRLIPRSRGYTGGEGSFTQWVHYEFVVSFEAICPVVTQQVCGEFF